MITSGIRDAFPGVNWDKDGNYLTGGHPDPLWGQDDVLDSSVLEEVMRCGCLHMDPCACDRQTPARPLPTVRYVSHGGSVTILIEE